MRWLRKCYIFGLHILLTAALVKSDFLPRLGRKIGVLPPLYRFTSTVPAERLEIFYERVDKNVPDGSILVIGDSFVHGLCVPAISARDEVPIAIGFGIGGDTLEGIAVRLRRLKSINFASVVVVQGGINDLLSGIDDDIFMRRYVDMLNTLPHEIPFVVVLLFPLGKSNKSISNDRIRELNKWITNTVSSRPMGGVLDLSHILSDTSDGSLLNKYHNGDGLHLNK